MTDKAQAERSPCEHGHVVSTGRDQSGIEWGRCADCGDDSFVIGDPTANADGVMCGTFSGEKVRPLDGHMLAGILRNASRASHPRCGDGMTLPERIERMHSLLARWADADHCHGHICDASQDGPCDVRRLEDETRAFLGERQRIATPKEAPSSDLAVEFERGRERGIVEAARLADEAALAHERREPRDERQRSDLYAQAAALWSLSRRLRALLASAASAAKPPPDSSSVAAAETPEET